VIGRFDSAACGVSSEGGKVQIPRLPEPSFPAKAGTQFQAHLVVPAPGHDNAFRSGFELFIISHRGCCGLRIAAFAGVKMVFVAVAIWRIFIRPDFEDAAGFLGSGFRRNDESVHAPP
jgi:hypothetical protein